MSKKIHRQGASQLQLTSMMDMFTIVLVFLLNTMSAEGNLMSSNSNLILPMSAQAKSPTEVSLTVVGEPTMILADNEVIVETAKVRSQDSLIVAPLLEILSKKREEERRAEMLGVIKESTGKVVVQFDKNTEYDVVTKVMATCGFAGYNNIKFAVTRKGEDI